MQEARDNLSPAMVSKIFCSDNCIHYKFSIIDTLVPLAPTLAPWSCRYPGLSLAPHSQCWLLIGWLWDEMHHQDSSGPRLCLIDCANCEKLFIQMLLRTIHHHFEQSTTAWPRLGRVKEGNLGTHSWKYKVALGDIDLAIRTRNHN